MKRGLLIFTKNIVRGQVKTRLAATIGNDRALGIYKQLVLHTVSVTRGLPVEKIVFYSSGVEERDQWDCNVYRKMQQQGSDLGSRMKDAFTRVFDSGFEEVAIIGTDCAEITSSVIMDGFAFLQVNDVVIGPATDGGYYLLALRKMQAALFKDIGWSTALVLEQTLAVCRALQLKVHLLPQMSDIDNEADLMKSKGFLNDLKTGEP